MGGGASKVRSWRACVQEWMWARKIAASTHTRVPQVEDTHIHHTCQHTNIGSIVILLLLLALRVSLSLPTRTTARGPSF